MHSMHRTSSRFLPLLVTTMLHTAASASMQGGYSRGGYQQRAPGYSRGSYGRGSGGNARGRGRGGRGSRRYEEKDDSGSWQREFDDGMDLEDDATPSYDATPEGFDALYGVSPILAALRTKKRTFRRLYLQNTLAVDKRTDRPALQEIDRIAAEMGLQVELRDKGALNGMCRNRPHQGLVLQASSLSFSPLEKLPSPKDPESLGRAPLWLALDEVTDPQNLGALLRSSLFLGVDGVLVSAKNSCPLTPVVSKASAGAAEIMTVHAARNLPRTLEAAKEAGWQVAGAALEESVEPEGLDATAPTVLVLGSEGHGLRTNVLRACSSLVRIPTGDVLAEGADLVDSLNVGVAGGILMYSLLQARKKK